MNQASVVRARDTSKRQYEALWSRTRECVDKQLRDGVRDIGKILDAIQAQSWEWYGKRYFREVAGAVGIDVSKAELSDRLAVQNGVYQVVPYDSRQADLPARLAAFIERHGGIDHVVELGSGYGHNLFKLHSALPPALRQSLTLHACELSDAGREVTKVLHDLDPAIPLQIHEFDYYRADFGFLAQAKSVLVFSSHSIEQIPELPEALYTALLAGNFDCHCIHAEPVGWQYDEALRALRSERRERRTRGSVASAVKAVDGVVFSMLGKGLKPLRSEDGIEISKADLGTADKISRNAALWSARSDYNLNLVSLLQKLADEERIELVGKELNIYGDNPFNPTTIITWKRTSAQ